MADTTTAESTKAIEATFEAGRSSYRDAVAHARGLDGVGFLFKALGVVLGIGGVIGGIIVYRAPGFGSELGLVVGLLGVMAGGGLYGFGFLLAAIGQVLLALIDTAVSTKIVATKSLHGAAP
ncbi:hypothetical protein [Polyangium sp. 15x6]|uniref:hypothetical protein n=1 Tax=Polyangium sp. 15x6 TaxID=3042687 RepID=UPI00249A8067|nr:hypothetical protein [Polyangium sp. 15x6]MDI3291029.1 hypothetical protein [Polyangium sp. 15x6]